MQVGRLSGGANTDGPTRADDWSQPQQPNLTWKPAEFVE
jgi:hypothetical protein